MGVLIRPTDKFALCGMQSTFRELGLYKGKIDGLFGGGCASSFGTVLGKPFPTPASYEASPIFLSIQKSLVAAGKDTKGVDGAWGRNTQAAFDSVVDDYRLKANLPSYSYAWSAHKGIPPEAFKRIEEFMTKWGKPFKHVSFLLSCMAFETAGTFSPSIQNKSTRATGLIQFMPVVAREMKTTVEALVKMSFMEQLEYVFKYFEMYKYIVKCDSVEDYYLSIFYPARVGKNPNEILARAGTKLYDQNKVFDKQKVGYYTVSDICESILIRYWEGMDPSKRLKK